MIKLPGYDPEAPVIVVDVGNTNTKVATWKVNNLKTVLTVPTGDLPAFQEAFQAHQQAGKQKPVTTIIGSVVPGALPAIQSHVALVQDREALVVGETLPLPLEVSVKDAKAVGVDRVCQAAAAYDRLQTRCTIVSFGTAVTIDLVDDEGVFLGGAILPGVQMQMLSLHEHTAMLPQAEPGIPELPYGRNSVEAIQTGVCRGLAGAVRGIVEGYATHLNRWPQVVATGGDAAMMMPLCDFIDTWATDLTLRGIGLSYSRHLAASGA
jgi:type III pantothenate kinase